MSASGICNGRCKRRSRNASADVGIWGRETSRASITFSKKQGAMEVLSCPHVFEWLRLVTVDCVCGQVGSYIAVCVVEASNVLV